MACFVIYCIHLKHARMLPAIAFGVSRCENGRPPCTHRDWSNWAHLDFLFFSPLICMCAECVIKSHTTPGSFGRSLLDDRAHILSAEPFILPADRILLLQLTQSVVCTPPSSIASEFQIACRNPRSSQWQMAVLAPHVIKRISLRACRADNTDRHSLFDTHVY